MRDTVEVHVPGGLLVGDVRRTDVELRTLTGADEQALQGNAAALLSERVDRLLRRSVVTVGGERADEASVAALTVGDREALLWHLRRHAIGERIDAVVECGSCHEKLDIDVEVGDLLQPVYDDWRSGHVEQLAGREVRFRLPTGADLAASVADTTAEPELAADRLLRRCVTAIDGAPATDDELTAVRDDVDRRIAALDPQAETLLTMACPSCAGALSSVLDAAAFLFEELARHGRHLTREVHTLAWYYHWSEADILGLPVGRRRRYLELIDDAVGGGSA